MVLSLSSLYVVFEVCTRLRYEERGPPVLEVKYRVFINMMLTKEAVKR